MNLKKVAPKIYQDQDTGRFHTRVTIGKTRTTRLLNARTLATAISEASSMVYKLKLSFEELANRWLEAGCPDGANTPRSPEYRERAVRALVKPIMFMGKSDVHTLGPKEATIDFGVWRKAMSKRSTGSRVADLELAACASLFNWAVRMEITVNNPFQGRSRFQHAAEIRHSTERAPESGDQVHQIAEILLRDPRSRSTGFLWLFLCLTGCRCGEMRKLRLDVAPNGVEKPPGFYTPYEIVIARGKQTQAGATRNPHGIIPLSEPAQELLRAWEWWHKQDFPSSPYWFPGRNAQEPLSNGALTKRLARVCDDLNIPHVSAHGGRAFFAKTLRQDELDDRIVAARLGHSNVAMVEKIYGGRMHERDPKLSWLPSEGPPAWHEWLPIKLAIHLPIRMR